MHYYLSVLLAVIQYDDGIPNVRVEKGIGLIELADVGLLQAAKLPGGVSGIIIFRLGDNEVQSL
jgi:hypothetical protein